MRLRLIVVPCALFLVVLVALVRPSGAHDWYPMECCHGLDCAPVDRVEASDDSGMTVTTRLGTARVPPSMTRRESKDSRMHACMRRNRSGAMQVICVFVPPES